MLAQRWLTMGLMPAQTAPPTAPPRPWMPAVFDQDAQGMPMRHRPARPHGDLWAARCGDSWRDVWLFEYGEMRTVMALTPCRECERSEQL